MRLRILSTFSACCHSTHSAPMAGAGGQAPSVHQVGPRWTIPELSTMLGKEPQRRLVMGHVPIRSPPDGRQGMK